MAVFLFFYIFVVSQNTNLLLGYTLFLELCCQSNKRNLVQFPAVHFRFASGHLRCLFRFFFVYVIYLFSMCFRLVFADHHLYSNVVCCLCLAVVWFLNVRRSNFLFYFEFFELNKD